MWRCRAIVARSDRGRERRGKPIDDQDGNDHSRIPAAAKLAAMGQKGLQGPQVDTLAMAGVEQGTLVAPSCGLSHRYANTA